MMFIMNTHDAYNNNRNTYNNNNNNTYNITE